MCKELSYTKAFSEYSCNANPCHFQSICKLREEVQIHMVCIFTSYTLLLNYFHLHYLENEDNNAEVTEAIKCKIPKSTKADVIQEAIESKDTADGKKEENGQPKHMELKKSKSYGAPSSRDYVHPKPNLKHSMSVNPNAVKTKGSF